MPNWIEHLSDPQRLYLAWQAPEHLGIRDRWAIGLLELAEHTRAYTLRYLRPGPEFESLNGGRTFHELEALGFVGYPAFNRKREIHETEVLETFMRRLPPRSRPDFLSYKQHFGLQPDMEISDFSLLGHTEAKLPSDGFSLVDPLDGEVGCCDCLLEVAGHRYYASKLMAALQLGQDADLQHEPDNVKDPNAVRISVDGELIGYINRLQAPAMLEWLRHRAVSAVIERLNGKPDHPRAFLFVRVRPLQGLRAA